jgi:hypothetical protein
VDEEQYALDQDLGAADPAWDAGEIEAAIGVIGVDVD